MADIQDGHGDGLEQRRRRLRYRAWRRGTREMDLMLGRYADANLAVLNQAGLDRFEALCEEADTDLWAWLSGFGEIPSDADTELLDDLRRFQEAFNDE